MIGLVVGRFQPFHLAHLEGIKNVLTECSKTIILIGSSQYSNEKENPFSLEERKEMIKRVLEKEHLNEKCEVRHIEDLHNLDKWTKKVIKENKFDLVYSNNDWVEEGFEKEGKGVKKLVVASHFITGTKIRQAIAEGKTWEKMVPEEVKDYLEEINGVERIKKLSLK